MKILIYGSGKTGTTALTYAIKNAFKNENYEICFEPSSLGDVNYSEKNLIVKSLEVHQWRKDAKYFNYFEKKVVIIRHPFDTIISSILYGPFNGWGFSNDHNTKNFISILKRKTEQPDSIPLQEIIDTYEKITQTNLIGFTVNNYQKIFEIVKQNNVEVYKLKYEDFVDGNLAELSHYLGTTVNSEVEVDKKFERVARSKKHSDWKNWFTQDDVRKMSELFWDFLTYLKYDTVLDQRVKIIAPEKSYLYVINVINEYRRSYSLPEYEEGIIKIGEEGNYIDQAIHSLKKNNFYDVEKYLIEAFNLNPNLQNTYLLIEERLGKKQDLSSTSLKKRTIKINNLVRLHPNNSDLIEQFFLDYPVKNEEIRNSKYVNTRYIRVKGWIIGKKVPAQLIAFICENQTIGKATVNIKRPGVVKLFPKVTWAENSGFEARLDLNIDSTELEKEVILRVMLQNEIYVNILKINLLV